jgi:hypothetical protein
MDGRRGAAYCFCDGDGFFAIFEECGNLFDYLLKLGWWK